VARGCGIKLICGNDDVCGCQPRFRPRMASGLGLPAGRPRLPPGYPPASFLPYPDLVLRRHPAALALPLKFTPLSTFTIRLRFKARAVRKAWMAYRTSPR